MLKRIKSVAFCASAMLLLATVGCKKGTFNINDVNPNTPSVVDPKFLLSGSLQNTAELIAGGDQDCPDVYMGYYSVSGDYIPDNLLETYETTSGYFNDNWNSGYIILKNFRQMESLAGTDPNKAYYNGIGEIMEGYLLFRLVDQYNNIPNSQALNGGTINFPAYDPAASVYTSAFNKIDSGIAYINGAVATAENPGAFDIMFGGTMSDWILFANTVKLRAALNLTKYSGGSAIISKEVGSLTTDDFLPAGLDATINPGYSNSSNAQQSPIYQDMGFNTSGASQNSNSYYRACSYMVNFLTNNNDPRLTYDFLPAVATNTVVGRPFGSTVAQGQDNQHISQLGPGTLGTPASSAVILPATESLFLQADAAEEGVLPGGDAAAGGFYKTAVEESFRLLGAPGADTYITQGTAATTWGVGGNNLKLIITQEWAALMSFDAWESWNNYRRLGYPSDLPVSIYPGTSATHIPYRLLYPNSEYQYNTANVTAQGTISNLTSTIFWMPQ